LSLLWNRETIHRRATRFTPSAPAPPVNYLTSLVVIKTKSGTYVMRNSTTVMTAMKGSMPLVS
jgi:hypothetical protein